MISVSYYDFEFTAHFDLKLNTIQKNADVIMIAACSLIRSFSWDLRFLYVKIAISFLSCLFVKTFQNENIKFY